MPGQIKSQRRGTKRFQVAGITDAVHRAYSLIAFRENRSLNAQLQYAVKDYLERHYPQTLLGCEHELPDNEIELERALLPSEIRDEVNRLNRRAAEQVTQKESVDDRTPASAGPYPVERPRPATTFDPTLPWPDPPASSDEDEEG